MILRSLPKLIFSDLLVLDAENNLELNWDEMELILFIKKALDDLYDNDSHLIKIKAHERSLVFRFGLYFNDLLIEKSYFSGFDLDFDYNRDRNNPKRLKNDHNRIFPDLILHKRGNNNNNILVLEFKTHWNENNSDDLNKLKELTSPKQQYHYKLGISIVLGEKSEQCKFVYVKAGKILKNLLILSKGGL
ncbi:hypothetical protein [Methanocalculus sp.]|uniref:hypothetical protein n=1 Tax=Methanocalculus sp. TaxID=2004547 RepID=UPI0017FE8CA1|nr:hypothetical protein [Methanocalculus sp.]HIJ06383.1 hypothetical protein [Methanocalculus sp.]